MMRIENHTTSIYRDVLPLLYMVYHCNGIFLRIISGQFKREGRLKIIKNFPVSLYVNNITYNIFSNCEDLVEKKTKQIQRCLVRQVLTLVAAYSEIVQPPPAAVALRQRVCFPHSRRNQRVHLCARNLPTVRG